GPLRPDSRRAQGDRLVRLLPGRPGAGPRQHRARRRVRGRGLRSPVLRHQPRAVAGRPRRPGEVAQVDRGGGNEMAVRLLTEADVARLLTMDEALEAVEQGLRKMALDEAF